MCGLLFPDCAFRMLIGWAWICFFNTLVVFTQDQAERNLAKWQEKNDQATEEYCVDLLQKLKHQHLEPVLAQLTSPEGSRLTFAEIIGAYSSIEQGFKDQAKGAKDVCARAFFNFHPVRRSKCRRRI